MLETLIRYLAFIIIRTLELLTRLNRLRYRLKKHVPCPPIEDDILLISAVKLAESIRSGKVKSEDVVRAYISRIKAVNPILNAVVDERFESALKEAVKVDDFITLNRNNMTQQELARRYPLLGLPITIKESISVEGMSFTAGKVFPGGRKGEKDADVVQRIKKAGGIILTVTNTPELCVNFETYNNVTGRTLNPYDNGRTCSGSSGGEAALLGSGASLLGMGSDLMGSARVPAHHCGVWGHKPSAFLVSKEGHFPDCEQENVFEEVFSIGPMVRYAEDLRLLLDVILSEEKQQLVQLKNDIALKGLNIYVLDLDQMSCLIHKVDAEIRTAIEKFSSFMESKHGSKVQQLNIKHFNIATEVTILKLLKVEYTGILKGEKAYWELIKYLFRQSDQVITAILPGIVQHLFQFLPKSANSAITKLFSHTRRQLQETLKSDGILVMPCHNTPAHRHGEFIGKFFDYNYTALFNAIGFPATSCPMGLNSDALPFGIQIVASPNNDRLCLAVAEEIQKEFGGWIPPIFSK